MKTLLQSLPATEQRLLQIKQLQEADVACQRVSHYCQTKWPERHKLESFALPYYKVAAEISVVDGLLLCGARIIIPSTLRREMLSRIHTGHQDNTKCWERARQSVWWVGISKELEKLVQNCAECCKMQKQRPQPLIPSTLPEQ